MPYINGTYFTEQQISAIRSKSTNDEFEKFLISGVVGFAVGSTVIGGLLGGSFLGGFVGDILEGTDDSIF